MEFISWSFDLLPVCCIHHVTATKWERLRTTDGTSACVISKQEQVLCEITFTKNKVSDLPTNLHDSIHPSTVTLPHASEPRLSTYVPYLRAEVTIRSWAKQALVSRDRAEVKYWKWYFTNVITYLYGHIAFCDLSHIETNRGNHVFTEMPRLQEKNAE